ncbi:putative quinol monooxygenase [Cocleimonas sp. KMM 6892]|uniref:putative quinol monooxygenase n=1 Tax=unclassified Cocleimonas TaxID=2639732 RepID=UPI002DB80A19|nr:MULTISPECIES: putative quinol monooxygenase [unclassified Cocleimonas]MEB8430748.1 putative quinol monooxygenase [Cocleimonas sp. KMM 6892]MEC4714480.1 putative quinol monooxygenase [Cocleimonas sp. KMM 6895]MEC4743813.1 putative quinol monooxygenase [Cocleimonas sp. KMM 6896]
MSEELSVVVLIEVLPGKREEQIKAFKKVEPLVLAEDGCLQYEMKADQDNENRFIMIERWSSAEALAAHAVSPHMVEAGKSNHLFRAKPAEIIKLSDI